MQSCGKKIKPLNLVMDTIIKTALISVFDKTGIVDFANFLTKQFGIKILSTGGTATTLRNAGVYITDVSQFTTFPECFDGRVKTLHPKVHGGLLYQRDNQKHCERAEELGIMAIDLVVINLYPFRQIVVKPNVTPAETIENIDIGGPSMLRSGAKNFEWVTVASDPKDYKRIEENMLENNGATSRRLRLFLAKCVFQEVSDYDATIGTYLEGQYELQY